MRPLVLLLSACSDFELHGKDAGSTVVAETGAASVDTAGDSAADTAPDPDSGLVVETGGCGDTADAPLGWAIGAVEPDPDGVATCTEVGPVDWTLAMEWSAPNPGFVMNPVVAPNRGAPYASVFLDDAVGTRLLELDGRNGSLLGELDLSPEWDPSESDDGSTPFVGDVDGDGFADFVTTGWTTVRVVDGATSGVVTFADPWAPGGTSDELVTVVDVDLDGAFEIVKPMAVFDLDGTARVQVTDAIESTGAFVMDLDGDALPEVVNGAGIWSPVDGSGVAWDPATSPDYALYAAPTGGPASADVVLTTGRGAVHRAARDGSVRWSLSGPGDRALAALADATGDGVPELCVVEYGRTSDDLVLVDVDGVERQRWTYTRNEVNAGGCAMADLDADGVYEVVHLTRSQLRILDARTGAALATESGLLASARDAGPIIADLDGDGGAEILVVTDTELRAYGPATGRWARTRPVWNQLAYDVTSIRDDGSLVRVPAPVWTTYGVFRAQPAHDGLRPDLRVQAEAVAGECETTVQAEVSNPGSIPAAAGATLRLLAVDRAAPVELATVSLPALAPGQRVTAELTFDTEALGAMWVVEVVPAHADECDWTNNRAEGIP